MLTPVACAAGRAMATQFRFRLDAIAIAQPWSRVHLAGPAGAFRSVPTAASRSESMSRNVFTTLQI
jgi:hypothetical protein